MKFTCEFCGKEFEPKLKDTKRRFCSKECSKAVCYFRTGKFASCHYCGNNFELTQGQVYDSNPVKYCSKECINQDRTKSRPYKCDKCGDIFQLTRGQSYKKSSQKHYCNNCCGGRERGGWCRNLIGEKFGRLTVIESTEEKSWGNLKWKCKCECGTISIVSGGNLKSGHTRSCGCLSKETAGNRFKTHGMTGTKLFNAWTHMRQRCNNPKGTFARWNGRGITVTPEWDTFEPFYEWSMANGYADNLSLDRIDNDKNYGPDNCRWATKIEQANNVSNNKYLTYKGKTQTKAQWAAELGITKMTFHSRIQRGLPEDKIFKKYIPHKSKSKPRTWKNKRLSSIYRGVKERCLNLNHKDYGGRGIKICDEWLNDKQSFIEWAYANGYHDSLTLERIDCNGDYEPSNCKWSTYIEQGANKRNNVYYEYQGEKICQSELARRLNIAGTTLTDRIKAGMSEDKIFHIGPLSKKKK